MAILHQNNQEVDAGFNKKFEAGSEALLMNFVQSTQYKYPEKSAVRELGTNAIDSIREKQRFFKIQSGEAKISDFYVEKEGDMYKDSKYDPTYYDEKWLSKTENMVKLVYKANGNNQRDTLHIIDTGVGLGGTRLEKSFNPLFSTKRLNTQDLGKFGVGSKSGLALQTDYYTIISRYNGMEFHFNVYEYKVQSTVPRFNMEEGTENPFYVCQTIERADGTPEQFYYLPTDQPNGVEVILQVKKGLRKIFFDAIKGQFLYMDGIEFWVHEEDGTIRQEPVKANIEYEDDIFVMPDASSTYYSKVHLILNGICYGYVDFLQMEEEERVGNIGLKIDPSRVDVTLNREDVQWTQRTTEAIHEVFKEGEHIAERLLNEALKSTDIIDWLLKSAASTLGSSNSIISRFANIVDVKRMKPKFIPMPKIKFDTSPYTFFSGYEVVQVMPGTTFSKAKQMHIPTVKRDDVHSWSMFNGRQVFYQDARTSFRQEMYMLSIYPNGFIKVMPKGKDFEIKEDKKLSKSEEALLDCTWEEWEKFDPAKRKEWLEAKGKQWESDRALMDQLIRDSKYTDLYSSIVVPEDFSVYEKEEEEDTIEAAERIIKEMSDAERRKLENKIVIHTTRQAGSWWSRQKREVTINEVLKEKDTIIYGFQEDEENLKIAHQLMGIPSHEQSWHPNPKLCMVAQSNAKYFKPHMYINDFFMSYNPETKTISMHNQLVKWQTARLINEALGKLQFLTNFSLFDSQANSLYKTLKDYVATNYVKISGAEEQIQNLITYANQVTTFQLFVAAHPDDAEAIAAKSKALFDTDENGSFANAVGIEMEPYQWLQELLEHSSEVRTLLNQVSCLTNNQTISYELEQEIKEYLNFKGYISLTKTVQSQPLPVTDEAETEVA